MTEAWPPPPDDATVWRQFTPHGTREAVSARQVPLWGRRVFIDDTGDVWCPSCRRFRTVADLGRPDNSCPVGIRWPEGTIYSTEPGDDGPLPTARPRLRDLLRERW